MAGEPSSEVTAEWGATQMVMQEAQLNTPEASTPERPRSRKLVAVIAGTVLAVILAATALSASDTTTAAQLRAYGAWPQSVKPLMDQIIAQFVISAGCLHQMSAITGFEQWRAEADPWNVAGAEGARLSTPIRQAFGLPQRATA